MYKFDSTPVYCPKCDKKFLSDMGKKASMSLMIQHLRRAHPDYYAEEWLD